MGLSQLEQRNHEAARRSLTAAQAVSPNVLTENTAARLKVLMEREDRADNRGRIGHVCLRKLETVMVKGSQRAVDAYTVESLDRGEPSPLEETRPEGTIHILEK